MKTASLIQERKLKSIEECLEAEISFSSVSFAMLHIGGTFFELNAPKVVLDVLSPSLVFDLNLLSSANQTKIHFIIQEEWSSWWIEDENYDLQLKYNGDYLLAWQRDFGGYKTPQGDYFIFLPKTFSDGVYNALRWIIPTELAKESTYLFHTASLLKDDGTLALALGESGAGKTTLSSFAPPHRVLGDDLLLVSFKQQKLLGSPVYLGQRIQETSHLNRFFPISEMLVLNKSSSTSLKKLSNSDKRLNLMKSIILPSWGKLDKKRGQEILSFIERVSQLLPIQLLNFTKTGFFWEVIHGKDLSEKRKHTVAEI